MKIIFFGNNERGIRILKHLAGRGSEDLVAVSDPSFDSREDWFRSLRETALGLGMTPLSPEKVNAPEFVARMRSFAPDLFILCGYSKLLGRELLTVPRLGAINLHAGRVPEYRGAAPLNWAMIRGEGQIGVSILKVDEGIDTGEIVAQETLEVGNDETIREVATRVSDLYCGMLDRSLLEIHRSDAVRGTPQRMEEGFWCAKRREEDGRIAWRTQTAAQVHNLVRALTKPYPGAFTFYGGNKVTILASARARLRYFGIAGRIVRRDADTKRVTIVCEDEGVEIGLCEINGEERMAYDIFTDVKVPLE